MTLKSQLLTTGAFGGMTANEQRLGRFIRDGEGHPAPAAPAAAEPPAPSAPELASDKEFADFERAVDGSGEDEGTGTPTPTEDDGQPQEPPAAEEPGASEEEKEAGATDEATRRAEEAEARAAELQRQLDEARKPKDAEQTPEAVAQDPAPNPDDYQYGDADPKFLAESARWNARQEFRALEQQRELQTQVTQLESTWKEKTSAPDFAEKYPDFAEKVTKGGDEGKWDCSPLSALLIKSSEVGPDIAYHLASNPVEAANIAQLNPIEQALAIGRLEGRYSSGAAQPKVQPKVVSEAPEPPAARTRGAGGQFAPAADTEDFASFEKLADGVLNTKK